MVNRLDVHTFIYFELASSSVVPVCEFVQKEVDRPTRLLQFLAFVHLPFSFRSLDLLVASLLFRPEGHFVLCYKDKIELLDRVMARGHRSA